MIPTLNQNQNFLSLLFFQFDPYNQKSRENQQEQKKKTPIPTGIEIIAARIKSRFCFCFIEKTNTKKTKNNG
jgi:hypothetical protein